MPAPTTAPSPAVRLEIGGGSAPPSGWLNLDPAHGDAELRRRVQDGIPLPDASVDEARAVHVMEHVPAGPERVAAMNEVWRVLRPGAVFSVVVPLFPAWQAIADPTHVSLWVPQSFDYFCGPVASADYGIRFWEPGEFRVVDGWEAHVALRKPRA